MLPRWDQTHKDFAIASLPIRFVSQLYFDLIKNLGAFGRREGFQIIGNRIGVCNLVHAHILSGHTTLLVGLPLSRERRESYVSVWSKPIRAGRRSAAACYAADVP